MKRKSPLKTRLLASTLALLVLNPASFAFAQRGDSHRGPDRGPSAQERGPDRGAPQRGDRNARHDDRGHNARPAPPPRAQPPRHDPRPDHRHDAHRGRGAGPNHNFYVGNRLPPVYRQRVYVVDDWRGHHLRQPPRGYHWVQNGGDYLLVAIATGVILQVLLGN